LDIHHLRYFLTVARTGSFARAADELSMAASPLSRRVKDLEHYMGARLFRREGGHLELTIAGIRLLPLAQQILDLAKDIERQRVKNPSNPPLRIGLVPSMPPSVSLALDQVLQALATGREISLHPQPSDEQTQGLISNSLDLGIVRVFDNDHRLSGIPLVDEEFVVVCSSIYGAALPEPLEPLSLEGWYLISSYTVHFAESIDRLIEVQNPAGVRLVPGADSRAILSILQHTRGFCLLPAESPDVVSGRYVIRHAPWPLVGTTFLQWRKDREDLLPFVEGMQKALSEG
jgi:DNA-binding transcriptional LysR family regulator